MSVLDVQNITLYYADRCLFDDVGFQLHEDARVALVGINGAGKTTLFNIIAGEEKPEGGQVVLSKGARLEYLRQSAAGIEPSNSLQDEIMTAHFADGLSEFEKQSAISKVYAGLGFKQSDLNRCCSEFSLGWQMRISLVKALVSCPDFLLLDEPTNYLDIESRLFLRNYLRTIKSGFVIVSHDKYFLDSVCKETYELFSGTITRYKGGYSAYETEKEARYEQQLKEQEKQQKEKKEIEEFIERFRYKATKARQVQERVKRLEKIKDVEVFAKRRTSKFSFPPLPASPNDVIRTEKLCKSFGGHKVIENLDLYVGKGERLAVIGKNGMGKSTLLNMLSGVSEPTSGMIRMPDSVKMKFFSQDSSATLCDENSVIDEVRSVAFTSDESRLTNMLGCFSFTGDDIYKKVEVLSGGEKSRVAILKLLLHPSNLLVLDEITNHLDIPTKEVLLNALKVYQGTIVFVSHDIDFIKKLATKVLYLDEEGAHYYAGDFDYFTYKVKDIGSVLFASFADGDRSMVDSDAQIKLAGDRVQGAKGQSATDGKKPVDYAQMRKDRNVENSRRRKQAELEAKIGELEASIRENEELLNSPEYYSDAAKAKELCDKINELKKQAEDAEWEWLELEQ